MLFSLLSKFLSFVILLIIFVGIPTISYAVTPDEQVVDLINTERQKQNLSPLLYNDKLSQASASHNKLMKDCEAKYGRSACFVHTVTLMNEQGLLNRIQSTGYNPQAVAENIAWGYTTAQSTVTAWMGSSGHKANILGNYKDVGCGYTSPYWTCDFGRSFTAGSSATPTPTQSAPTLTPTQKPTPTLIPPSSTPTPTLSLPTPTTTIISTPTPGQSQKPWYCKYIPTHPFCR